MIKFLLGVLVGILYFTYYLADSPRASAFYTGFIQGAASNRK